MTMDAVTEKISHFIGTFETILEEARMRAEYDEFRAMKAAEQDAKILDLQSMKMAHGYKLEDVDAKLDLATAPPVPMHPDEDADGNAPDAVVELANAPLPAEVIVDEAQSLGATEPPGENIIYHISPPSALAQVTLEYANLIDNDMFGPVLHAGFQTVASLQDALEVIVESIDGLQPLQIDLLPTSGNWSMAVQDIQDAVSSIGTVTLEALTTVHFTGAEAMATFANGVAVEDFESLTEILPQHFAEQVEASAETQPNTIPTQHDFGRDFNNDDSPYDDVEGHKVIAGANTLTNSAAINSTWLDAGIIAASGDVVRFDAISQLNVIVDHDAVPDLIPPSNLADQQSTAANIATIAVTAFASGEEGSELTATSGSSDKLDLPDDWVVVRYEGPLAQINWVEQHTFTTDFDSAEVTISGSATYLGLGENTVENLFEVHEFGFEYDLILVGGSLIDINLISQTNVLLDSDVVDTIQQGVETSTELASTQGSTSDGQAGETLVSSPSASNIHLTGAATDGDTMKTDGTVGIEVAAETEEVDEDASEQDEGDTGAEPQALTAFSTGDNLVYNEASIETIGADTDATIEKAFSKTLDDFIKGGTKVNKGVLKDEAFDGIDLLRVLYIDGDFTTVNVVDQINILGDADQVHLAQDQFAAALQDQIELTTGSNVLSNIASIKDTGKDSKVMAEGETYSDALIYQANLVDTDLENHGQTVSELATEAVAFLAEDMIGQDLGQSIAEVANGQINDVMSSSDVMQTMLA